MSSSIHRIKDIVPVVTALIGVFCLVFLSNEATLWMCGFVVLLAIVWYCVRVSNKPDPSDSDIDSVYYFGFVITIVTLVFTIFHVAYDENLATHSTQIITQFGLGLAFTAVALVCRIFLLLGHSGTTYRDVEAVAGSLADNAEKLALRFEALNTAIGKLAENANSRSASLLQSFEVAENQFNTKAKTFGQWAQATEARLRQADDELDTILKRAQAREIKLVTEFNEASQKFNTHLAEAAKTSLEKTAKTLDKASEDFLATVTALAGHARQREQQLAQTFDEAASLFNENLASAAKASLGKAAETIDQSNREYATSIEKLCVEIGLMQKAVKDVDFTPSVRRIEAFSASLEAALGGIQSAVDSASLEAADAIGVLSVAAQQTHTVAVRIGENLDSLGNLEQLTAQINRAADGLEKLARRVPASDEAIAALEAAAQSAATATGQLERDARSAAAFLRDILPPHNDFIAAITQLNETARLVHALAQQTTERLERLQGIENLASQVEQAGAGLQKISVGARQSAEALEALEQRLRLAETREASPALPSFPPIPAPAKAHGGRDGKLFGHGK